MRYYGNMTARVVALLLVVGWCCGLGVAPRCSGKPNAFPIFDEPPQLVKAIPNAKLFRAGPPNNSFHVLHVWGTPYEQGYAQGRILQPQVKNISGLVYAWISSQVEKYVPWLPPAIVEALVTEGVEFALQLSFNWTRPFIPQRYLDEMQGIADGAGVDVRDIQNVNQFPELTKAACTVIGATNASSASGRIMHLRALDFDPTCPIADYPQVTIYHDSDGFGLANFGWTGMIGVLTGFSSHGVGVGEKVWDGHPANIEGVEGKNWMLVLRDALRALSTRSALRSMQAANRTCAIFCGLGDNNTNTFRGVTMAKDAFDVYDDLTLNYTQHPILPGIMYWDKHVQPTSSFCLSDLLQEYYGKIDAATLATTVSAVSETGDMHSVAMDYGAGTALLSVARRSYDTGGELPSYYRQFSKLDLQALFGERP